MNYQGIWSEWNLLIRTKVPPSQQNSSNFNFHITIVRSSTNSYVTAILWLYGGNSPFNHQDTTYRHKDETKNGHRPETWAFSVLQFQIMKISYRNVKLMPMSIACYEKKNSSKFPMHLNNRETLFWVSQKPISKWFGISWYTKIYVSCIPSKNDIGYIDTVDIWIVLCHYSQWANTVEQWLHTFVMIL